MTHKGEAYPASGAIFLDNPIRRWLQPPSELVEKLEVTPNDIVVDFGCGPGYYTVEVAKRAKAVIAIDISPTMLSKAQNKTAKAGAKNIQFLQGNGRKIQCPDSSVNKILLVTVYHEVGESETVLKEFSRILKPSGKLIIVEAAKRGIFTAAPVQNPETLKAEIEAANFKLQQMYPYRAYGVFFFSKNA